MYIYIISNKFNGKIKMKNITVHLKHTIDFKNKPRQFN